MAIATAGLLATLVAAFFTTGYMLRSFAASSAAKAVLAAKAQDAALAKALHEAKARRIGTIVLTSDRGGCEELRFDNPTGAFISATKIECDERLTESAIASSAARETGAGMRSMLESFKK
jgi:hypothetical protein